MRGIRSSSKRKWVVGGAVIFAAAALLTTGFATWIVGAQNNLSTGNVNVSVDTAENNFLEFDFDIATTGEHFDHEISLSESKETYDAKHTGDVISLKEGDYLVDPLKIEGTITISVGKSYLKNNKLTGISYAILEKDAGDDSEASVGAATENNLLAKTELIGEALRPTSADYTYLREPETTTFATAITEGSDTAGWTVTTSGDMTILKKTAFAVDFRWGSFFDNKSPFEYYNGFATQVAGRTAEQKANIYGAVTAELSAMREQLNTKKIRLQATLLTEPVNP